MTQPPKLVIVGRDGILNEFREDHVKEPAEWVPVPGALEALARLTQAGWHAVVATNQSGIGRGLIDLASVNAIHAEMMRQLAEVSGRIDAVFFCPHAPEDGCACRKPKPGLMHEIGRRYGVELTYVPMVCDTLRDVQAAHAAGCEPHLLRSGRAAGFEEADLAACAAAAPRLKVHDDLPAFVAHIAKRSAPAEARAAR